MELTNLYLIFCFSIHTGKESPIILFSIPDGKDIPTPTAPIKKSAEVSVKEVSLKTVLYY